jgi:hypothetical protein
MGLGEWWVVAKKKRRDEGGEGGNQGFHVICETNETLVRTPVAMKTSNEQADPCERHGSARKGGLVGGLSFDGCFDLIADHLDLFQGDHGAVADDAVDGVEEVVDFFLGLDAFHDEGHVLVEMRHPGG